jgi:hypothetical protein
MITVTRDLLAPMADSIKWLENKIEELFFDMKLIGINKKVIKSSTSKRYECEDNDLPSDPIACKSINPVASLTSTNELKDEFLPSSNHIIGPH